MRTPLLFVAVAGMLLAGCQRPMFESDGAAASVEANPHRWAGYPFSVHGEVERAISTSQGVEVTLWVVGYDSYVEVLFPELKEVPRDIYPGRSAAFIGRASQPGSLGYPVMIGAAYGDVLVSSDAKAVIDEWRKNNGYPAWDWSKTSATTTAFR